jgi:hypothetical protein
MAIEEAVSRQHAHESSQVLLLAVGISRANPGVGEALAAGAAVTHGMSIAGVRHAAAVGVGAIDLRAGDWAHYTELVIGIECSGGEAKFHGCRIGTPSQPADEGHAAMEPLSERFGRDGGRYHSGRGPGRALGAR